ncbi:MAG: polysaccharide biosynthesis tyrosine autokinase [Rothia sp. (in: high G+C Gram-positive bacteria)]|nr:polysaccharide biosynthesis tyrosine autokinase [Rothia sp. (in: high G+C Gram-positive bacteria)]
MKEEQIVADAAAEKSKGAVEDFLRTLRRSWYILVLAALLGAGAGLGFSLLQPKIYASDATGVVTTGDTGSIALASASDTLTKSKATQYQVLATSRTVAQRALELSGYQLSPEEALSMVSASVPLDTAQIKVTVRSQDPEMAKNLADAWIKALGENVKSVENSGNQSASSGQAFAVQTVMQFNPYVPANTPQSPISPNLKLNTLLGLIIASLIGLLLLFIRSIRDRSIRSLEALIEVTGPETPVLGTIPFSESFENSRLIPAGDSAAGSRRQDFRLIESLKELRTNLQFKNPDNPPRRIVVTSSLPSDGKSTVADNLAIILGQAGKPVFLVDADLRRPTVAKSFGLVGDVGVTDVVIGRAEVEDVIQLVDGYPNLYVLAAGRIPPNPSEILNSEAFAHMIDRLAQEGLVILDAPPLLPVTDSAILATKFDGALVVVEANGTKREELTKALGNLSRVQAEVLGTVLNKVPASGKEAGYYHYYGKDYYYDQASTAGAHAAEKKRKRTKASGSRAK